MSVSERIFSVIMDGFIAHLGAVRDKFQRRGQEGNASQLPSSHRIGLLKGKKNIDECHFYKIGLTRLKMTLQYIRKSLGNWEQVHRLAAEACKLLTWPNEKFTRADAESRGLEGLRVLSESVRQLDKIGSIADWDEATLEKETEKLLDRVLLVITSRPV